MTTTNAAAHNFSARDGKNQQARRRKTTADDDNDRCSPLPTMIVFDLDDCLWTPEMHELYGEPSIPVKGDLLLNPDDVPKTINIPHDASSSEQQRRRQRGVVGMQVPRSSQQTVRLFDGARTTLLELVNNPKYSDIILAVASTSLEPRYSHICLENIEILPSLTLRDIFKYDQIGRTGRLTSHKTSHFRLLQEESGIPFEEMLFFDDGNWYDHCAAVTQAFGVVSQRTPQGMRLKEFYKGLEKYKKEAESR